MRKYQSCEQQKMLSNTLTRSEKLDIFTTFLWGGCNLPHQGSLTKVSQGKEEMQCWTVVCLFRTLTTALVCGRVL